MYEAKLRFRKEIN